MKIVCGGTLLAGMLGAWLVLTAGTGAVGAEPAALSSVERRLLDGLMKEFVFDPQGAQYVRVKAKYRAAWGRSEELPREGWLVASKNEKSGRVYFMDGESMAAPAQGGIEKVDFVEECRWRYTEKKQQATERDEHEAIFQRMRRGAVGQTEQSDLVIAVWLNRLGQSELAATALARARKTFEEDRRWSAPSGDVGMIEQLREELAWGAFAGMVHAYMVRADEEALSHGERLVRLYPDVAKREYGQTETILGELKRRKTKGTFGKTPSEKWPEGFEGWDQKKKIARLIDWLDEVDARQLGQPGGVSLGEDRRVAALVAIGDPAVPALIDAVEKDERLTRSVHFWRDFARSRTVLSVREAAVSAVMSILRVRIFRPAATGDDLTSRGPEATAEIVKQLREYWKKYGGQPFDERMMRTLVDAKSNFEAAREAASNLASLGEERRLSTMVFSDRSIGSPMRPNPAVAKFSKPTVAEAMIAAMDRDLAHHAAGEHDQLYDYHRRQIEDTYLGSLVGLGDKRIAAKLARRARAATAVGIRCKYASACYELGDSGPLKAFAEDVRRGSLKLPANDEPNTNEDDQPGTVELTNIVAALGYAHVAECDRALDAIVERGHPYYALAVERVFGARPGYGERPWLAHQFCLTILRQALDDSTPTGKTWSIKEDKLTSKSKGNSCIEPIPEYLADPATRRAEALERKCDEVAAKVSGLVLGAPDYHAIMKDADARVATMRELLDRYRGRFRLPTREEADSLGLSTWEPRFVPDIRPLGRPATADDVAKGLAVFHLAGEAKVAAVKLPAVAVLAREKRDKQPRKVLVVQAEIGQDGKTTYGIIGGGGIRGVAAEELSDIRPIEDRRPGTSK